MEFCAGTARAWAFIGMIILIIRIVIPILIILLGTIDLGKAVLAGEEKTIKEAQKSFIRRLIYGVAIFFVIPLVKVSFGLLGLELEHGDTKKCWQCAAKPQSDECKKYMEESDEINDDELITGDEDDDYNDDEIEKKEPTKKSSSSLDEL